VAVSFSYDDKPRVNSRRLTLVPSMRYQLPYPESRVPCPVPRFPNVMPGHGSRLGRMKSGCISDSTRAAGPRLAPAYPTTLAIFGSQARHPSPVPLFTVLVMGYEANQYLQGPER
jgi:hypothetical protein